MKLWLRYGVFLIILFVLYVIYLIYSIDSIPEKIEYSSYFKLADIRRLNAKRPFENRNFDKCSMSRCFNYSKCLWREPKVYVYPTQTDVIISPVYEKILRAIRDSAYYTEDPSEACLFVLSLDTTDRDRISDNYIKDLSALINALPQEIWNEGRNHLIFNLYYGSYPDYSQKDIGFLTKNAIVAWASADSRTFRQGFDISFPLFHKEHPLRVTPQRIALKNPENDRYLSSFKGKRYVYGIGSNTRDSLYHLHNHNSTIIATTCRHNTDWKKFEDSRCGRDNREYDNYDYITLLENSSFCLTPRGRRLGSFRFLEALKAGCIPVILSDGWELPFSEIINWSEAAIQFHERAVYFTTDVLNEIETERIAKMKLNAQLVYQRYFSSVEKVVLSTIQAVFDRLKFPRLKNPLFSKFNISGKFTGVIQTSKRFSNRVTKIIDMMAQINGIERFIVMWPKSRGAIPEKSAFPIKQDVEFIRVDDLDQENLLNLPSSRIQSDFLLFVDERIKFNASHILNLMDVITKEPTRLVTYHALSYQQSKNQTINFEVNFSNQKHSIGLLHLAAISTFMLSDYQNSQSSVSIAIKKISESIPQCPAVLFNIYMAQTTVESPIWLKTDVKVARNWTLPLFVQQNLKHYGQCLNKIVRAGYEENRAPLLTSKLRYF